MRIFFDWILTTLVLYIIIVLMQSAAQAITRRRAENNGLSFLKRQLSLMRRQRAIYYQNQINDLYYNTAIKEMFSDYE